MNRATFVNAFQPATEVDEPARFAGRRKQVSEMADALHLIGSIPLIYGDRGLGKSSLGAQLQRIARGDVELLDHLDLRHLALEEDARFMTFTVTCTDATKDLQGLLQLCINAVERIEFTQNPSMKDTRGRLVDRTTRKGLTLKFFTLETSRRYETERQRRSYEDLNLEGRLSQVCEVLTTTYGQPVMFIVDELDRLTDPRGLASFLKSVSGPKLKFTLIGIASNHSELLGDHESVVRQLNPIHLPPMTDAELGEIVAQVEDFLAVQGQPMEITETARRELVQLAGGFPWFVHVLGRAALLRAIDHQAGSVLVVWEDVEAARKGLAENRFAQQFKDQYQNAVRDSKGREVMLRVAALWAATDIPTSELNRIAYSLNVTNTSGYKSQLCSADFGSPLTTPVFQERGLLRFKDQMFKTYVRMRPSIHPSVDEETAAAYEAYKLRSDMVAAPASHSDQLAPRPTMPLA